MTKINDELSPPNHKNNIFAAMPVTLSKVIFGKNYIPPQNPHKNFDLARNLCFQICFLGKIGPESMRSAYIDFIVKTPLVVNLHSN